MNNTLSLTEGVTGTALPDFAAAIGKSALTITGVSISGESIVLTVKDIIQNDVSITVGYTANDKGLLKDGAGNALKSLESDLVVDLTNDTRAPEVSAIETTAGTKAVVLKFDEVVSGSPDASDFTILLGDPVQRHVVALSSDGMQVTVTISDYVQNSQDVKVSYVSNSTSSKKLLDFLNLPLGSFSAKVQRSRTKLKLTMISVSSSKSSGSYKAGEKINIDVKF